MNTEEPWIETRRGGVFFVNALLVFPHVALLVPLVTRILVRSGGGLARPSTMVDTFPTIAEHLLPRMGPLLLAPIALVLYNLRIEPASGPRTALLAFLLLHGAALGWGVSVAIGVAPPMLPGAPP